VRIVQISKEISLENKILDIKIVIEPGKPYIMAEYMASQIKEIGDIDKSFVQKYKDLYLYYDKYNGQDLGNKNLVLIREGGIGDLIFLTPFARFLKEKYPSCKIMLCCNSKFHSLFTNLKFFDVIFSVPIAVKQIEKLVGYLINRNNTYFLSFESLIEEDWRAKEMNVYDLFAQHFGLQDEEIDYHPQIYIDDKKRSEIYINFFYNKELNLDIGFQMSASSPLRCWKPEYIKEFLNKWKIPNTRFFILDSPNRGEWVEEILSWVHNSNIEIINLADKEATLQRTIAVVSYIDLVIAPDSSISHIAACVDTPMIVLFGAFYSDYRLKYYKKAVGINAMSDCKYALGQYKSCFEHGHACTYARELNRIFAPCMDILRPNEVSMIIYNTLQKWGMYGINENRIESKTPIITIS